MAGNFAMPGEMQSISTLKTIMCRSDYAVQYAEIILVNWVGELAAEKTMWNSPAEKTKGKCEPMKGE